MFRVKHENNNEVILIVQDDYLMQMFANLMRNYLIIILWYKFST